MVCALSVNVNAVAYLRNRRGLPWPNVVEYATLALQAGAHGITVHPRPDARHITRQDVFDLAELLRSFPECELNIEGYPSDSFLTLVENVSPHQVTLVPDSETQITSDHGFQASRDAELLKQSIARLERIGSRISVFIDPDPDQIPLFKPFGIDRLEIYTGPYGAAVEEKESTKALRAIVETAEFAFSEGFQVNAGHDLTLSNLPVLLAAVPRLSEVSIGHALVCDALFYGFFQAVSLYVAACKKKRVFFPF